MNVLEQLEYDQARHQEIHDQFVKIETKLSDDNGSTHKRGDKAAIANRIGYHKNKASKLAIKIMEQGADTS